MITDHQVQEPAGVDQASSADAPAGTVYSKGTLHYTKMGLLLLFFFLLWGDFCTQMMFILIPELVPLQLKSLGASNMTMAVLVSTLPAIFHFTANPAISFRSDNFRSRWGRRRPFLFIVTPFVALALLLMAWAPDLAGRLQEMPVLRGLGLSHTSMVLGAMAVALVLFQLFNTCLQPIYGCLLVDVVPERCMGRFMALFRIVLTMGSYLFNTFIYGQAPAYTRSIYIGAALFYFVGFMLMCWWVREGDYPPPAHAKRLGLVGSVRVYARECYSHPHYLLFNVRNALWAIAFAPSMYIVFVVRDELGISLDFYGKAVGWFTLGVAVLLYPLGSLSDRIKPVRLMLLTMMLLVIFTPLTYFFLQGRVSLVILWLLNAPISALIWASESPMYACVPPRDRFGQFVSANSIFVGLIMIPAGMLAGKFIDLVTSNGTIVANYRYLFVWEFVFQVLGLVAMYLFYRSWLKYGGPDHYVPPEPRAAGGMGQERS